MAMAEQKAKNIEIKLMVEAGKAKANPQIGSALGQHGVNIRDFCVMFNDQTKNEEQGILLPVILVLRPDKKFSLIIKKPPVSTLIKKTLNLKKGSGSPKAEKVGKLTEAQLRAIATEKMKDLSAKTLVEAMRTVAGTARSMGIDVDTWE
jgi:large subunit ribosomal protein L11